jgi:hypothetical protein
MAVAVELSFEGPGATLQNYFEAIRIMGATPEGPHPDPACLFHWVAKHGNGFRVTDVFQTRGDFERFARDTIAPISAQVGIPQPHPAPNFIELANFLT